MSPCLIWWIARRDHELCPGYKERTPARSFSSARQCTRVGFGTACMTLTFRVNQTWYSQNTVRCASCMDASGTGTPVADSPLPHRHVRNTGKRSSKVTSSAISRAGRSFWSLDGGLRSSGNARCAIIAEKRQQAKSISGCGGRSSSTRLAFEARERPTGHSSVALVAHVRARRAITLQHGQQLAVGQLLRPLPGQVAAVEPLQALGPVRGPGIRGDLDLLTVNGMVGEPARRSATCPGRSCSR